MPKKVRYAWDDCCSPRELGRERCQVVVESEDALECR
jgi:hypothetical protein